MSDLVERLRYDVGSRPGGICEEAADEIERLQARLAEAERLLREWAADCYCQQDSLKHPDGCGRCADTLALLRPADSAPACPQCGKPEAVNHGLFGCTADSAPAVRICNRCNKAMPEGCEGLHHGNIGCALNNPDHADRRTRKATAVSAEEGAK